MIRGEKRRKSVISNRDESEQVKSTPFVVASLSFTEVK